MTLPPIDTLTLPKISVLDQKVLNSIRQLGGNKGGVILKKIIEDYLTTCPQLLSQIEQAIAQSNVNQLKMAVHSLGSSSANLGATAFAKHCKVLENLARAEDLSTAQQHGQKLVAEYQEVKIALEMEVEQG